MNLEKLDIDLPSLNRDHLEDDLNQGNRELSIASDFKLFSSSQPNTPSYQSASSDDTPQAQRFQTADPFERLDSPTEEDFDFILEKSPLKKKTVQKETEFVFTTRRFEPFITEKNQTETSQTAMATSNPPARAGPGPMEHNQGSPPGLDQHPPSKEEVSVEELAEYRLLWQELRTHYVKWERARTMISDQKKSKMLLRSSIIEGRKVWTSLMETHQVEEEEIIQEMKSWMINGTAKWDPRDLSIYHFGRRADEPAAQQQPTATHQPSNSNPSSHRGRSAQHYNHSQANASREQFQAYFRAQVEVGRGLEPSNPPSCRGHFSRNYRRRRGRGK